MSQHHGNYPPQQPGYDPYQQQHYQQHQQHQQHQHYQQQQHQQPAPAPQGSGQLDAKGLRVLSEVKLLPREEIVYAIRADGYFLGVNPIAKLVASVQALLTTITGGHVHIYLVVTNQRLLLLQSRQAFCGWARARSVNAIALASLAEAGSDKVTQWCCIHSRTIHVQTKTQRHAMVIRKLGDDALRDFVANLSAVLVANVQAGTVT